MNTEGDLQQEFEAVIIAAYRISEDIGRDVEDTLRLGREQPLTWDQAERLLSRVIDVLKRSAVQREDATAQKSLEGEVGQLVSRIAQTRDRVAPDKRQAPKRLELLPLNGVQPGIVSPRPCFHGREVAMNCGFVKTTDIFLWNGNERLEIHLGQFRQKNGRDPNSDELLDIMLSKMDMAGLSGADQFEIVDLARSIAVNGVRKPPIVDQDGTLLDGNRRVAACYYILNNEEFTFEQKQRVQHVFVWQLTDHATNDERNSVVVSLNFEPDCKQDWPEYVKARKVHEEWQAMMAIRPRLPGPREQADMKRELSKKFALGPDTAVVNRYLKMVDWANEFEEFHINQKKRDKYEVKHKTNRYFQYFDELAKGTNPGGVAYALNQDDSFKQLVFDLLYQGKFRNWRQIRELKLINDNDEARELLQKARDERDEATAEEQLENAMSIARTRRAEMREVGANTRIESFVRWLEELPVRSFRDVIKRETLERLLKALKLVETQATQVLSKNA